MTSPSMPRCETDKSIERKVFGSFNMPLGVYPIGEISPAEGFTSSFERADGGADTEETDGEWAEWPDRYVYEVTLSAERIPAFLRQVLLMMPGRAYGIFDYLGQDAYREVDSYLGTSLVGLDRILDGLFEFAPFLLEDGFCGFGAVSEEPYFYVFLDEHKMVTIRTPEENRSRVESLISAFGLTNSDSFETWWDGAEHEHRSVLYAPVNDTNYYVESEILEELRDHWSLELNIDPDSNTDDDGNALGFTCWRCIVREESERTSYIEVFLVSDSLSGAQLLAIDGSAGLRGESKTDEPSYTVISADRMKAEDFASAVGKPNSSKQFTKPKSSGIISVRRLE